MLNQFSRQCSLTCRDVIVVAAAAGAVGLVSPDIAAAQESAQPAVVGTLQEVIVTARRREENLQSVPTAITAISQEDLRKSGVATFNDLQFLVPSMTLANGANRNNQFVSIRGISGLATDGQAVVSYLNEVPLPPGPLGTTGGGGPGLFYDLDRVDVLKGPQGTLFGRNTLGGAIAYQTKRPTEDFGGYLEAAAGDYNDREINGALNLPISGKLLVRLAVNDVSRDGFTKSQGTAGHPDGVDLDDRSFFGGRGTITFKPIDQIQNDFIYSYVRSRDNGASNILTYVDPDSFIHLFFPTLNDTLQQQQALGVRRQVATDGFSSSKSTFESYTDIFRYDLTDDTTLRNIASQSRLESIYTTDADGTEFPIFGFQGGGTPFIVKTYTEELQLLGKSFGGNLTWVAGGFYEKRPAQPFYSIPQMVLGEVSLSETRGSLATAETSQALYAQGTYDLAHWIDGLKFTAGYRYSWDKQFAQKRNLDANGDCVSPPPGADVNCTLTGDGRFSGPNWTVGFDYQVVPQTLLYVTSRHGYHSGGMNLGSPIESERTYQPETLTDIEVGAKSDWEIAGMRARTNVAIYRSDYEDVQTLQGIVQDGAIVSLFGNAAAARTYGVEFEGTFIPTDNLKLTAQFDWLDFKYTEFGPGVDRAELERETLQNRPKFKYGVSAEYDLPVAQALGRMSVNARWSWQDKTVVSGLLVGPSPVANQEPYGLLMLGANWDDIAGKPVDLQFFMTNALDKTYATGGWLFSSLLGFDTLVYGEPRMYGFRLRYRFGDQ